MRSMLLASISTVALGVGIWGCASDAGGSDSTSSGNTGNQATTTQSSGATGTATEGGGSVTTNAAGPTGTTGAGPTSTSAGMTGTTGAPNSSSGTATTGAGGASTTTTSGTLGTGGAGTGTQTSTTGGPPPPEPSLITSGPGAYWQEGEVTEGGNNATVTVNVGQTLQQWHGFGGTFNEKGWDALKAVSPEERDRAIRLLFSATEGAGFTFGRIPIGSSDYGLDRYSLAPVADDYTMENFSIDRDRQDLIPYIKAALAVKPDIRFWASPWSPPPWMKTNNAFDRGNIRNEPQVLQAHALYLARFVEEYAAEGINIEAVHPQNEPGYQQDYPSCGWSAEVMTDYIANYMGPLFAERLPGVEVWLGTMSNPNSSSIVSSVMGNATAAGYVKGIGLQWGMGDGNAPSMYASQYGIPIMQTEHICGNFPWAGADQSRAPNDHNYALESWGYFKNWIGKSVNSYLAWNMVLDTLGRSLDTVRPWAQNALLAVDRNSGTLQVTPTYYVFRHLAQYVEPGSVRVQVQGGDALAWQNPDGSVVTILHNSGQQPSQTTLSVDGTLLTFSIPASGWATVNWQG